jgi:hypothetical protein
MPRDLAPPEMARDSLSLSRAPLESASSIRGANAEADLEALVELSKLPSNVIEFSH